MPGRHAIVMRLARAAAAMMPVAAIAAAPAASKPLSFLACPVAQDRGSDQDLCFFVIHKGQRYTLSNPVDSGAPQLGHRVLVEGSVTDQPGSCGGLAINGIASVMPELSPECRYIAPPDPQLPPPPPVPQERARQIEAGREAMKSDPRQSLAPFMTRSVPPPAVLAGRTETIYYPFDSDRSSGPDAQLMVELARLAAATPGARVVVNAWRGASRLDDGTMLTERRGMARARADKVAGILAGLGVRPDAITATANETPASPKGVDDWKQRRVQIVVRP